MKKIFCIAGIVVGAVMCVIGLAAASYTSGNSPLTPTDYSFGADYYTEQFAATRDAAINIAYVFYTLTSLLQFGGRFVAVLGAAVVCYFGYQLGCIKDETVETESVATSEVPVAKIDVNTDNTEAVDPEVTEKEEPVSEKHKVVESEPEVDETQEAESEPVADDPQMQDSEPEKE